MASTFDLSAWLENKLGTDDLWTSPGSSFSAQLNPDLLRDIKEVFADLHANVKIKLLMSILRIPKRNLQVWKGEVEGILDEAKVDSEQWVATLAEIIRPFPTSGCFKDLTSIKEESIRKMITSILDEFNRDALEEGEKRAGSRGPGYLRQLLPVESLYLNKAALNSFVGGRQLGDPGKHFVLKEKGKSKADRLKEELLQKSAEASNQIGKKLSAPVVPLRTRGMPAKMSNNIPLRGIPREPIKTSSSLSSRRSFSTTAGSASSSISDKSGVSSRLPVGIAAKRDCGIKFLEISEQPPLSVVPGSSKTQRKRKKQPMEGDEDEDDESSVSKVENRVNIKDESIREVIQPSFGPPLQNPQHMQPRTTVMLEGFSGGPYSNHTIGNVRDLLMTSNTVRSLEISHIMNLVTGINPDTGTNYFPNPCPNLGSVQATLLHKVEEQRRTKWGTACFSICTYFVYDYGTGGWRIENYEVQVSQPTQA